VIQSINQSINQSISLNIFKFEKLINYYIMGNI
jgi:hypothetical protein